MTQNIQLTQHQQEAFDQIKAFLSFQGQAIFILKGYAGTGKTTLLQHVAAYLQQEKIVFSLLAPTGRAAAVLSAKTGYSAHTIHSELYHFKDIDGDAPVEKLNAEKEDFGQMRLVFDVRTADEEESKIYIVDEASMVGDERNDETSFATFGSGHLLSDLLGLAGQNKIIFAGDPCQLPPVGSKDSPALTNEFFTRLGIKVFSIEMTQILRQKLDSDILKLATRIRSMTTQNFVSRWIKINAKSTTQINIQPYELLKDQYIQAVIEKGTQNFIAISQSNQNCHHINLEVRKRLYGNPHHSLQKGDLLMVTQNNYLVPLTNGDFVEVEEIGREDSRDAISFLHVKVKARLTGKSHEILLCLDPLYGGVSNLTQEQQRQLMIGFSIQMRSKGIKPKSQQYHDAMRKDPYLNSLRANYGYAVTCHKSQGGEWDEVFFFLNKGMYQMDPPELSRWWYTGITRAKEKLHLVDEFWISDYNYRQNNIV